MADLEDTFVYEVAEAIQESKYPNGRARTQNKPPTDADFRYAGVAIKQVKKMIEEEQARYSDDQIQWHALKRLLSKLDS